MGLARSQNTRSTDKNISIYQQWKTGDRNLKPKPSTTSKPKILRYKYNKMCVRPVSWKLRNVDERNQMKMLMTGIKENLNTQRGIMCSWFGKLNIVEYCQFPPNRSIDLMQS